MQGARHPLRSRALRALAGGLVLGCLIASPVLGWREGPPPDRVYFCGFGATCADTGCHDSYAADQTELPWRLELTSGLLPEPYVPGRRYPMRLIIDERGNPFASIWGFELAPVVGCPFPVAAGDLVALDLGRTRRFEHEGIVYLSHRCTCVSNDPSCCGFVPQVEPSLIEWTFLWDAPRESGTGDVTFALGINAANADGTPLWDRITLVSVTVPEDPTCPPQVTDLRLAKRECGMPGDASIELTWSASGAGFQVRSSLDPRAASPDRAEWTDAGRSACLPLTADSLVFYSLAEDCASGEGAH